MHDYETEAALYTYHSVTQLPNVYFIKKMYFHNNNIKPEFKYSHLSLISL